MSSVLVNYFYQAIDPSFLFHPFFIEIRYHHLGYGNGSEKFFSIKSVHKVFSINFKLEFRNRWIFIEGYRLGRDCYNWVFVIETERFKSEVGGRPNKRQRRTPKQPLAHR